MGYRPPTTTNFQHAITFSYCRFVQCAPHFRVLSLWQRLRAIILKPGRGIIHGFIKPIAIKRIAQIVMGVDVAPAATTAVAVQYMAHPIDQLTPPRTVKHTLHLLAINDKKRNQRCQVGSCPVALNITLGKTNITGLQRRREHIPVIQTQGRMGLTSRPKAKHLTIG